MWGILVNNLLYPVFWVANKWLPPKWKRFEDLARAIISISLLDFFATFVYLASFAAKMFAPEKDVDRVFGQVRRAPLVKVGLYMLQGNLVKAGWHGFKFARRFSQGRITFNEGLGGIPAFVEEHDVVNVANREMKNLSGTIKKYRSKLSKKQNASKKSASEHFERAREISESDSAEEAAWTEQQQQQEDDSTDLPQKRPEEQIAGQQQWRSPKRHEAVSAARTRERRQQQPQQQQQQQQWQEEKQQQSQWERKWTEEQERNTAGGWMADKSTDVGWHKKNTDSKRSVGA